MLNILLSFHHIKFIDGKNEIYFKILFNYLWNIFKRCRGMPLQGHLLAARFWNIPIGGWITMSFFSRILMFFHWKITGKNRFLKYFTWWVNHNEIFFENPYVFPLKIDAKEFYWNKFHLVGEIQSGESLFLIFLWKSLTKWRSVGPILKMFIIQMLSHNNFPIGATIILKS